MDFENVAAVNEWNEASCLRWMKVRLTGRAQTAFQRFPQEVATDYYKRTKEALQERFEPVAERNTKPSSKHEEKGKKKDGPIFAEDLSMLADKAYPDLEDKAKEQKTKLRSR